MTHQTLQQIIKGDTRPLSEIFTVIANAESVPEKQWRQKCANSLFERLVMGDALDPVLRHIVDELKPAFIHLCSQNDSFYSSPEHPLRQLFNWLLSDACHWCPRDAKNSLSYQQRIQQLIATAKNDCLQTTASFTNLESALTEHVKWQDSENKRATMLETRLCETELNNLKMLTAECRVLDIINNTLADCLIPDDLHSDIINTLKSELQHCVFNAQSFSADGNWEETPFWKCWQRLLPHIAVLFAHDDEQLDDQRLYSLAPALMGELERSLQIPTSHPQAYQQFVDNLSAHLMLAVQKQTIHCSVFPPLPYPDGHSERNTHITETLREQSDALHQGDWILFDNDNEQILRCKLALKNASADQLLFVDYSGKKVMIKSSKDIALCLSTGIAKPLKIRTPEATIVELTHSLLKRAEQVREQQKSQAEALALVQAEQQKMVAEQQRLAEQARAAEQTQERERQQQHMEEQLAARKAAARKAMAEARALAEDKVRREQEQQQAEKLLQEQQQTEQAKAALAQHQAAIELTSELHVGAWLELHIDDKPVRSKLSVIIGATGKYIFVDQVGRKLAEHNREQLAKLLASGHARVISKGDKFEDQLAKVIRGLRKDIST